MEESRQEFPPFRFKSHVIGSEVHISGLCIYYLCLKEVCGTLSPSSKVSVRTTAPKAGSIFSSSTKAGKSDVNEDQKQKTETQSNSSLSRLLVFYASTTFQFFELLNFQSSSLIVWKCMFNQEVSNNLTKHYLTNLSVLKRKRSLQDCIMYSLRIGRNRKCIAVKNSNGYLYTELDKC